MSSSLPIYVAVTKLSTAQRRRIVEATAPHPVAFADDEKTQGAPSAALAQAAIVFGNVPSPWLVKTPAVRWAQLDSAGVDAYLKVNEQRRTPILFTHLREFYDRAVSEAAIGGILAFHRQLPRLIVAQRERRWIKPEVEPHIGRLHGAHVVMLGAGAIGRRLGRLLEAFECDVTYFARHSSIARLHTEAELDAALGNCELLVNTLPHTPDTFGLLNAERLARLPASALVVNVGRGSALDEDALLAALNAHRLAGAVLDVTREEPLPVEHPLWLHPRVILTQHTGGRFPGETDAKIDVFLENFARFSRGERLIHEVEAARGY